jgi:hypothetical protein
MRPAPRVSGRLKTYVRFARYTFKVETLIGNQPPSRLGRSKKTAGRIGSGGLARATGFSSSIPFGVIAWGGIEGSNQAARDKWMCIFHAKRGAQD